MMSEEEKKRFMERRSHYGLGEDSCKEFLKDDLVDENGEINKEALAKKIIKDEEIIKKVEELRKEKYGHLEEELEPKPINLELVPGTMPWSFGAYGQAEWDEFNEKQQKKFDALPEDEKKKIVTAKKLKEIAGNSVSVDKEKAREEAKILNLTCSFKGVAVGNSLDDLVDHFNYCMPCGEGTDYDGLIHVVMTFDTVKHSGFRPIYGRAQEDEII